VKVKIILLFTSTVIKITKFEKNFLSQCINEFVSRFYINFGKDQKAELSLIQRIISGNSSVGRASASQAEGRGFESRFPLTVNKPYSNQPQRLRAARKMPLVPLRFKFFAS
jgi:hypothetical protein